MSSQPALSDVVERLRSRLGGLEIEQFNGDNFAVWLCSQFDDPFENLEDQDECGWGPTATAGYEAVIAAVHAHYAPTIERLSAERLQLREALGALHHAVRDLGEHDAISKLTYFEESPTKNGECHWRWVQLANAQGKAVAALSNTAEDTRHD